MTKFKDGVPFDPGYSKYGIYFPEAIRPFLEEYAGLKSLHQKKFKLSLVESQIYSLIEKCTAFYLGCLLWGAFIHYKFKDNPREIIDNPMKKLSKKELDSRNYSDEIDFMLKFFEAMDRDYKYFLKRQFKVSPQIISTLNIYKEFATLNDNFKNIETTDDVKLPKAFDHFKKHSAKKLDALYNEIMGIIESNEYNNLLQIGFYE